MQQTVSVTTRLRSVANTWQAGQPGGAPRQPAYGIPQTPARSPGSAPRWSAGHHRKVPNTQTAHDAESVVAEWQKAASFPRVGWLQRRSDQPIRETLPSAPCQRAPGQSEPRQPEAEPPPLAPVQEIPGTLDRLVVKRLRSEERRV